MRSGPLTSPHSTARGERLKEATVEAKRVIDQYRQEKEKQFEDFVKSVRGNRWNWCGWTGDGQGNLDVLRVLMLRPPRTGHVSHPCVGPLCLFPT